FAALVWTTTFRSSGRTVVVRADVAWLRVHRYAVLVWLRVRSTVGASPANKRPREPPRAFRSETGRLDRVPWAPASPRNSWMRRQQASGKWRRPRSAMRPRERAEE